MKCLCWITFSSPQVDLASLDHLNLQLSACGFSLHEDPDKNFIFRVSYSGCFVHRQVWRSLFHLQHLQLGLPWWCSFSGLMLIVQARLLCPDAEFGEEGKPLQRPTSQSHDEVSCWISATQQGGNPVWPRVYPGNCWLDFSDVLQVNISPL